MLFALSLEDIDILGEFILHFPSMWNNINMWNNNITYELATPGIVSYATELYNG